MSTLRTALTERVVVADGAIGTMLQASDAALDDFAGHEGCNEILNVTLPDIVTKIHEAYLATAATLPLVLDSTEPAGAGSRRNRDMRTHYRVPLTFPGR